MMPLLANHLCPLLRRLSSYKVIFFGISVCLLALLATASRGSALAHETINAPPQPQATAVYELKHDLSPPLREIVPNPFDFNETRNLPLMRREIDARGGRQELVGDAALQITFGPNAMPETIQNFEGTNNREGVLPPDTNGDVGPNHYVQYVIFIS